ncbi:MAG TPA: hypothetical protein VM370_09915 [Candidatus Thermoplasmatota archaeon]|nr:hypothetical protein [Candidatus Thermoplasmatota archaeon]
MDASTTGAKASISKRNDKGAGARRARVVQALVMQGGLAIILLGLAFFQRSDTRSMLLYLATLVVPIGWGYAFWSAFQREEAARGTGRWDKALAEAERKRTMGILGALVVVWVAAAVLLFMFL